MGKKKPIVSVVIPSYNSEHYLPNTIDSVLAQKGIGSLFDLEVIVVDDGSTDDTQTVIEKYGERVIYRRIKNSGRPAVPRNIGAKIAKGQYLAFLDADDVWLPGKLFSQITTLLDNQELLLISSNAEKIDAEGLRMGSNVVSEELLPSKANLGTLINENYLCTSATVVKRSIFKAENGFNELMRMRAVEDYELWLRIAAAGKISYNPSPTILYRVHGGGISNHSPLETWRLMLSAYSSFAVSKRAYLSGPSRRLLEDKLYEARIHLYELEKLPGRLGHLAPLLTIRIRRRLFRR